MCVVRNVGITATDRAEKHRVAAPWHAAAKGRRASLCIDADDQ